MRTIAHISDLHFGRTEPAVVQALTGAIVAAQPDVVVVSGDLTQRAKSTEFVAARAFIDTLPGAKIVVPGNHDVPLYNVVARWLMPLTKYRRYVTDDLTPFYADEEIAVGGINTARSLTFKNGRINPQQVEHSCARFLGSGDGLTRVLVTHHPLDAGHDRDVVGRAQMAMAGFSKCRIDLILAGHLHASQIGSSAHRYRIAGYAALLIQAGTATSSRRRDEPNAWNLIRIDRPSVSVDRVAWDETRNAFAVARTDRFALGENGWSPVAN
ncbi:MAG: metallophosphoesterase [Alphaproteobacteria bacterium]|nr:metallophosphoesterase [Alphaproteobacteria bacterium]